MSDACSTLAKKWSSASDDDLNSFSADDLKSLSSYEVKELLAELLEEVRKSCQYRTWPRKRRTLCAKKRLQKFAVCIFLGNFV